MDVPYSLSQQVLLITQTCNENIKAIFENGETPFIYTKVIDTYCIKLQTNSIQRHYFYILIEKRSDFIFRNG